MAQNKTDNTNTVLGVIAHVDAGKTTLSEAVLYTAGMLRKQGHVDTKDTVMDSDAIEKARGITVFSSEAHFTAGDRPFTLLDTPGHVDFSTETERTFSVLDACILVISGLDGVQAHTKTLWRLLSLYEIPTFLFVTKMDYARRTEKDLLSDIRETLSDACVPFGTFDEKTYEEIAMCSEDAMDAFLKEQRVPDGRIAELIRTRQLFPVFFGSGMTLEGVPELIGGIVRFTTPPAYPDAFSARVFKITHDTDGNKLVHMKLLGGRLLPKDTVITQGEGEKVQQLRIYNGEKYSQVGEAHAGDIVTALGLSKPSAGSIIGRKGEKTAGFLKPIMRYSVVLPENRDPVAVLPLFRQLEEEDPSLSVSWNGYLSEIQVGLMGEVQGEVLKSLVKSRFGFDIEIRNGHVLYAETIQNAVEGVGHYEPLRHYAEVHLLLEPLPRGSRLQFALNCPEDSLARNWQNLILQHLKEKEHIGVLTGSPITDIRITVRSGRAHLKHTEGGDFRQATWRAVRNGLMKARSEILEPYYRFRLRLPTEAVSRAMNEMKARFATCLPPLYEGETSVLVGRGPVTLLNEYAKEVAGYTSGRGELLLEPDGYDTCHDPGEVRAFFNYEPLLDRENPASSVFCAHGAGYYVEWADVERYMHLESIFAEKKEQEPIQTPEKKQPSEKPGATRSAQKEADELEAIMLREFGPIKRPQYADGRPVVVSAGKTAEKKRQILLVDGYNVVFAWEELRELATADIQASRDRLIHILINYAAFTEEDVTLVFDGYRVPGNHGEVLTQDGITIVYTKERESGDLYIEKRIGRLKSDETARVVTSDGMIQLSALRKGVVRVSSAEFGRIVEDVGKSIEELLHIRRKSGRETIGDTESWREVYEQLKKNGSA
ncbi:MAG: TetM/TetW/TetO/TetS family tetracycline resistance ribosomal protection protein [Lachnospiraceae bacterium]|nr:TetM/TetW/TetO/TetS family tetracycline resistance ribosomal protection protein [Lachnospiraceae bacterium]